MRFRVQLSLSVLLGLVVGLCCSACGMSLLQVRFVLREVCVSVRDAAGDRGI